MEDIFGSVTVGKNETNDFTYLIIGCYREIYIQIFDSLNRFEMSHNKGGRVLKDNIKL